MRVAACLLLLVLLAGCGGGGASTGGTPAAGPGPASTALAITVNVPQRQDVLLASLGDMTRIRADLYAVNTTTLVQSATADVPSNSSSVRLRLNDVAPGAYDLLVLGLDSLGNEVGRYEQQVQLVVGQVTVVEADLSGTPPAPPVAVDDAYNATVNQPLSVPASLGVQVNDTSAGGTTAVTLPPTSGSLTLNPDGSFVYTPDTNFQGVDTFHYQLTDANGSDTAVATITVAPSGAPPVAADDAYSTLVDVPLSVPALTGVQANDMSSSGTATVSTPPGSGTLTLNPDGSFLYTPSMGFQGMDTFVYTLTDVNGSDTATVTLTVSGSGLFVKNDAPGPGDGSLASPFNTLAAAVAASAPGDTIFVFEGDGTSAGLTGNVVLQPNQSLIGEAEGLIVNGTEVIPPGGRPVLSGRIEFADGVTVAGLENNNPGATAFLAQARSNVALRNCHGTMLNGLTGADFPDIGGTVEISDCLFENASAGVIVSGSNLPTSTVSVVNNQFLDGANHATDMFLVASMGHTMNIVISDNVTTSPSNSFLSAFLSDGSTTTLQFQSNTVNSSGGTAVGFNLNQATLNAQVDGNTFSNTGGSAVFFNSTQGTLNATVQGNSATLVAGGSGLVATAFGGTVDALFQSNTVNGVAAGQGIEMNALGGGPATNFDARILSNQISGVNPGFNAVAVLADDPTTLFRARIEANTVAANLKSMAQNSAETHVGFVNNVFSSGDNIRAEGTTSSEVCLTVTGNQGAGLIDLFEGGTVAYEVENLGTLSALNNGSPVTTTGVIVNGGPCSLP